MGHQNAKRALPKVERKLGDKCICGFCDENTLYGIARNHNPSSFWRLVDKPERERGKPMPHWTWKGDTDKRGRSRWLASPAWRAAYLFYFKDLSPYYMKPCSRVDCVNPHHCGKVKR